MEKGALDDWLKDRLHDIKKQAASVAPDFFPERIHELRTETKKLRAMMRLLAIEADEDARLPKAFRKAYKAAGAIRDRQMQLQYVATDRRHPLPLFAVWLAHETAKGSKDWKRSYGESVVRDLEDEISGMTLPSLQLQTLGIFLRERQDAIAGFLQADPDDEALHEIRKLSKDMGYVLSFCRKNWPEAWTLLSPLEKVVERLSDKAGAYNDRRNLLQSLEEFQREWNSELDDETQDHTAKAAKDWTESKARERMQLITAINRLTSKKIRI